MIGNRYGFDKLIIIVSGVKKFSFRSRLKAIRRILRLILSADPSVSSGQVTQISAD
jgi:hypothetical protein